jgi:hypothetical protein
MIGKQFKTHAITVQSNTPFESMTLRFVDRAEQPVEDLQVSVRAVVHDNGTDAIVCTLSARPTSRSIGAPSAAVVVDTPDNETTRQRDSVGDARDVVLGGRRQHSRLHHHRVHTRRR